MHKGTEVIYICINGDINRPVLLGIAPNADNPSPVTSRNPSQNILRTWGGNELIMDDIKNFERADLFTKDKQNILSLINKKNANKIRFATLQGEMNISAQTFSQNSNDTNTLQAGKDHLVEVCSRSSVQSKNQDIHIQSGRDIKLKAKQKIDLKAKQQNLTLQSDKHTIMKVKDMMQITSAQGDITINSVNGSVYFKTAKGINLNARGKVTISQCGAKIHIDQNGNIKIRAAKINIRAKQSNLQGN